MALTLWVVGLLSHVEQPLGESKDHVSGADAAEDIMDILTIDAGKMGTTNLTRHTRLKRRASGRKW